MSTCQAAFSRESSLAPFRSNTGTHEEGLSPKSVRVNANGHHRYLDVRALFNDIISTVYLGGATVSWKWMGNSGGLLSQGDYFDGGIY
jgi:hypothetical protein